MMIDNWPILQVIIPLCASLITALLALERARIIGICAVFLTLCISIYGVIKGPIEYTIGGWKAPIGIEYSIDNFNQLILCVISSVLLFMLFYSKESLSAQFPNKKSNGIVYSLLLIAHTGFSGIILTNDLFNLYVFLEIASLSTYALVSINKNHKALIGALDYLIIGTVGASFILMAVGILFSITGSLNIDDIHKILATHHSNKMLLLAIFFFILGCFIKIALFPLNFWLLKAYRYSIPSILIYIAPTSSIVGYYILLRFIYSVCDSHILYHSLNIGQILLCLSIAAILINSYCALKAKNAREIVLYSSVAQSGYLCILLIFPSNMMLDIFIMTLLTDVCTKMSFFILLDISTQKQTQDSNRNNFILTITTVLSILISACIPLTIGFVNKINMLTLLIENQLYLVFVVILMASVISLEYHYRLLKIFLEINVTKTKFSIILPTILSFFMFILYHFQFTITPIS